MNDMIAFTLASGLNESEQCQLRWTDNDEKTRTGAIARLEGGKGSIVYKRFKYTEEAWAIVQRQPRQADLIFPFVGSSISDAFHLACRVLHIKDLVFSDLRFEAICRLFERGLPLHEVAEHTQIHALATLRRYQRFLFGEVRSIRHPRSTRLLASNIDELR